MDASVFGTGSIVLNKAQAALNIAGAGSNTVSGYSNGGFVTQNRLGRVDPSFRSLQLNWALPTGSPADFPMVLNYHSNSAVGTAFGFNWSANFQRAAETIFGTDNIILANPQGNVTYTAPVSGDNYRFAEQLQQLASGLVGHRLDRDATRRHDVPLRHGGPAGHDS